MKSASLWRRQSWSKRRWNVKRLLRPILGPNFDRFSAGIGGPFRTGAIRRLASLRLTSSALRSGDEWCIRCRRSSSRILRPSWTELATAYAVRERTLLIERACEIRRRLPFPLAWLRRVDNDSVFMNETQVRGYCATEKIGADALLVPIAESGVIRRHVASRGERKRSCGAWLAIVRYGRLSRQPSHGAGEALCAGATVA